MDRYVAADHISLVEWLALLGILGGIVAMLAWVVWTLVQIWRSLGRVSQSAAWVNDVIDSWKEDSVPEQCQQFGCQAPVATWCPLCRSYFCHAHDSLYPRRMHDCLKGKAEAA